MADALSRNSLHMSALMVRDLIEQFRDLSLVCEITPESVKLGMLKLISNVLEEIKKDFPELKKIIIEESHRSSSNIHPRAIKKLTEIYFSMIVKLHGIPSSIVLDRDLRFTSRLWESLQ
ncbi:uncharacterized protein LOC131605935 [Vicia villosa]|uniref:uncharacterized protein LOC131605935 n=1 Tax=Vicia villosa TaxID=3911 RepID=UPI00273AAAC1|nr:uncharacterized protein LOC131605935 [Vicia villosa]